ncbi:regulator of chromosome condensation 1/beta-lactamase-inhibitor protein II [Mycena rebaudengoi]|nr:regulator of chromosome condensation 1/beta-lactamase-inhibitor protein II [Mycena rebaudengoi]
MLLSAGSNARGQLSNGSLDDSHSFSSCSFSGCLPGTLPVGRRLAQLASGANHTLTLLRHTDPTGTSTTELWGCGDGESGQLGPSYESSSVFTPLKLSLDRNGMVGYSPRLICASWETTYVVLSCENKPDALISMGANDFGDLGIGAKRAGKLPVKDFHVVNFDHLSVDGLPFVVDTLAAGQHHVVAKLKTVSADLIVGWGTSRHGQLGKVDQPFLPSPTIMHPELLDDITVSAALGHQHTVFLHASGTVSAMGSNRKHQLQDLGNAMRVQSVDCTWNGTYMITRDGDDWDVLSAGNNANGQLGRSASPDNRLDRVAFPFTAATHRLVKIACGSEHVLVSFVVDASGATEVWGWGWNEHGNLGVGTTQDVRLPVKIWDSNGTVNIWAGSGTSWIAVQ